MYDEQNYRLISDQLVADHRRIALCNRAQLLDDAFDLAFNGRLSYNVALNLTTYLHSEREFLPWNAVSSELQFIDNMLHNLPQYVDWKVI